MQIFCNESFPNSRLRRGRFSPAMRDLIAENSILPHHLILPIFIIEGNNSIEPIDSLPDVYRLTIDKAIIQIKEAWSLGIKAIALFCVVEQNCKNPQAKEATNSNNLMCRAIREIKNSVPEILIIADVALDPYTSHGHDGIIDENYLVKNDETIQILCEQSLIQARAGCDIIAPSDMMDGRVKLIRQSLDRDGFDKVSIMSYSAKYASNFYSPFRQAIGSDKNLNSQNPHSKKSSDKKNYQMDYRNKNEALREIALDISEGADSIIIKPAMTYLDIVSQASQNFVVPIVAYQVSGEYAMLKLLSKHCKIDFKDLYLESLLCIKRAGATGIISYGALELFK